MSGLDVLPPGLTDAAAWEPGGQPVPPEQERVSMIVAGVGRVPGSA